MDFFQFNYKRLKTSVTEIGPLKIGGHHSILPQTMTTPDTMDTEASVAQVIECHLAGAALVRLTAPSRKEAAHLEIIKEELVKRGYEVALVADIHFTPNAADIAAQHVEKVRVNPGNYVDKKRFEHIEYTDESYQEELKRIEDRFLPLIQICKKYNTAIRIGTNHGSLSDRIMSRYGDTPVGMVESAMEFLRIARKADFNNLVISMKSSNPQVMVQAYRLLVVTMLEEFGEAYPLHLGVTEAGDGEDGRVKSAVGIGALLIDGIGDTIRVSLTEEPALEIPVCQQLSSIIQPVNSEQYWKNEELIQHLNELQAKSQRRNSRSVDNTGKGQIPIVALDWSLKREITLKDLADVDYKYDVSLDKWLIGDHAVDYIWAKRALDIPLPGSLRIGLPYEVWLTQNDEHYIPILNLDQYSTSSLPPSVSKVLTLELKDLRSWPPSLAFLDHTILRLDIKSFEEVYEWQYWLNQGIVKDLPIIFQYQGLLLSLEESLIAWSAFLGYFLLQGYMDGIGLPYCSEQDQSKVNQIAFSILQATRARISKTEYISCPSCGRTLFDLQETTAKVRARTYHLKGLKIAIMGCIVNGPGEMADADFGYVGSGPGKITLYKNKEVVKRNIDSEVAVEELVNLLKENGVWVDPPQL